MLEKKSPPKILIFSLAICLLLILYFYFKTSFPNLLTLPAPTGESANLIVIFLTGLFTGGLTCLAVQGGLLAATIAQNEEERLKQKVRNGNALPILAFLASKLFVYTVLGLLLGWFGSLFQLSLTLKTIMQFSVAIFMLGTAFNILELHPIFRYFVVQPPKFLTRLLRKQSKAAHFTKTSRLEKDIFAPAVLGAFTVFIPCGTTQAMMAVAIASGRPLLGAAVLFAFILGTSPVFFLLGYFTAKLGDKLQQKFMRFAALAIILLAIFNLNNAVALTGSRLTLNNFWQVFLSKIGSSGAFASGKETTNEVTIDILPTGYYPNNITVKAGSLVTLHLKNDGAYGCTQALIIPKLGLQKIVPVGRLETITFKAPKEKEKISFMCSMGMFRGTIDVI